MSDTLYHATQDGDRFTFAPAPGAIQLGDYERRLLTSLLLRKLAEYHEAVTGPRDRIGSALNTVDAAVGTWQTLASINRTAAEAFQKSHGLPSRWVLGPVVDSQGFLCQGIYHERVEPAVSPPRYVTPTLRGAAWAQGTEHEARLQRAEAARRTANLLDPEEVTV